MVDGLDRDIWFANAFSGTAWAQGDANYDGVVDGRDLDLWKAHASLPPLAGASSSGPGTVGASVPEPGTLVLLAAGLIGLLAYGWRKRK